MLFSSADYPLYLAAVFFLYGLSRQGGRGVGLIARVALMTALGDVVYLLLVKATAALWDPIGGPLLALVTGQGAAPLWHYAVGAGVLGGSVLLGVRGGA